MPTTIVRRRRFHHADVLTSEPDAFALFLQRLQQRGGGGLQ
jgi:hypothetical protein